MLSEEIINVILEKKMKLFLDEQRLFEQRIENLLNGEYERIRTILLEKETSQTKEEVEFLKKKNIEIIQQYNTIKYELEQTEEENRRLCDKIDEIKVKLVPFEKQMKMWNELEMLTMEKQDYITQLCGNFNIDACLSLGRDVRKIEQLWYYLRDEISKVDTDKKEIAILNHYFEYCLKIANSSRDVADHYVFFEIEIGSEFDKELCIRSLKSKQIGFISNVLSRCVKIGDKVVYKAIVQVE